jgi:hypothetical protein
MVGRLEAQRKVVAFINDDKTRLRQIRDGVEQFPIGTPVRLHGARRLGESNRK